MGDILEDQKIHYIVKDYQRMFSTYNEMVEACKQASKALEKKNNKIAHLENKLEKYANNQKLKHLKGQISLISDQYYACKAHAEKGIALIESFQQSLCSMEFEEEPASPSLPAVSNKRKYLESIKSYFKKYFN